MKYKFYRHLKKNEVFACYGGSRRDPFPSRTCVYAFTGESGHEWIIGSVSKLFLSNQCVPVTQKKALALCPWLEGVLP